MKRIDNPQVAFDEEVAQILADAIRKEAEKALQTEADDTEGFLSVCFLLASEDVGPYPQDIADLLMIPVQQVARWAVNAEANEIWKPDGTVAYEHWYDKKGGTLNLILDSLCIEGRCLRRFDRDRGGWVYRAIL